MELKLEGSQSVGLKNISDYAQRNKEQPYYIGSAVVFLRTAHGETYFETIDGQQRLTSILLAYLGYMPNKEKFDESYYLADGDDSAEDMPEKKSIKWTFQELLQEDSNTKEEIKKQLNNDDRYEIISM